MTIFSQIVYLSFIIWVLRNLLFWVGLWQDKEYRIDRLLVHFKETLQGRSIFFSVENGIKWAFIFFYGFIVFHDNFSNLYEIALGAFLILQGFNVFKEAIRRRIKRPVLTLKAIALLTISFALIVILLIFPLMNSLLWLLIIDRLLSAVVALFVFFFAFPTEIYQDIMISRAKKKMSEMGNILIIAVSGSYGKTSTKEYISQILSKKFRVVKTPGSNNTAFGIANTILKKIEMNTEIFVVELGAYKRGEIAELTNIVRPEISVTTAISDQHISLYGSLQNVIESEYELLRSLPKNGLSLFNGNSDNIEVLYERAKTEKILYTRFIRKPPSGTIIGAYKVKTTAKGTNFTAILKDTELPCMTNLFGIQIVENILPAIYLADHLGFKKQEIIKAVEQLQAPAQTMTKRMLRNGAGVMDDTFNASPESVMSAMDFLKTSAKKKLFVLAPLTELGKNAGYRHYQIGEKASDTCDYLFLLNKNYSQDILRGVAEGKGKCQVQIARPEVIANFINSSTKRGDMIIFEGKESKMVLKKLL